MGMFQHIGKALRTTPGLDRIWIRADGEAFASGFTHGSIFQRVALEDGGALDVTAALE